MHAATAEFDEEQHVEPPEPHRLHREEIDGDHASCLRSQELAPRGSPTFASRPKLSLAQHLANSCRRDDDPEAFQLADETLVPPARILPRKAKDQLANVAPKRWAPRSALVTPAPCDESPMPAQQCRWCHHERAPAVARHEPTGRGQEDPVHGGQRRAPHPETQDRKLVMEHDDFQFLECVRLEAKNGQLQDTSNNQITERHEHEASARMATSEPFYSSPLCSMLASSDTLPRPRSCATWIKFTHPTRRPGLSWQAYLADCLGGATAPRTVRSEHIEVRAAELGIMLTDDLNAGFADLISRKDRAAELIKDRGSN